jgi:hypothetical protein
MAKKKNQIERVNFYKQFQLNKLCALDDLRPVMQNVYFKDGYAFATDAHAAIKAKVSDICNLPEEQQEMLNGHGIFYKHFELILKANFIQVSKVVEGEVEKVTITVIDENSNKIDIPMVNDLKYPDIDKILTTDPAADRFLTCIGFNYALLGKLKAAMGLTSGRIEFNFTGHGATPIQVSSNDIVGLDIQGIIMPILID